MPPPGPPAPGPPTEPTAAVRALQQQLADLGYLPPEAVDGVAGEQTRFAVIAFQKWAGLGRDGVVGPATQAALATATRPTPRTTGRRAGASRCCSTASSRSSSRTTAVVRDAARLARAAPGYETPTGRFSVFRKEANSWSVPYKVWLPWASYFVGGVAFHESPDVPS